MKLFHITLIILLLSGRIYAQEWFDDFDTARTKAKQENKTIIMVFQGSDWCAPCIRLSRQVWETEPFREYAVGHFVMVQVDFPRRKQNALPEVQQQKNAALAEKYNRNGIFPLVVILNPNGDVLGETGYLNYSPEEYIDHLNSFILQ